MLTRQIREAVDIADLVGSYVNLRRSGANLKGLCPFHEEKTPSFMVHPVRQTFKCFGCGAGGDVFTFVQMKENVDFLEARRILADRAGVSLDNDRSAGGTSGPGKTELARANDWARRVFVKNYESQVGQAARDYVAQRGINGEMAAAFDIGLSVDSFDSLLRQADASRVDLKLLLAAGLLKERAQGGYYDTFRHRLMFPIRDANERIIGFGGRTMGDDPAKYLNTPTTLLFDKSRNLFGLDRARRAIDLAGRAIVVEGYTDCIMAHQFGFAETVATLGTAMTEEHARLLRRFTDRVILLFDSDTAGQKAADRALSVTLTVGLDVALARVPEGKDPCDYLLSAGKSGFDAILKDAVGALEFKWRQVSRQYNTSQTGPGRRRAVDAYLQQLSEWFGSGAIDPIQTGLILNQLSQIVAIPAEDLHRQLRKSARASAARSSVTTTMGRSPEREKSSQQEALRQIIEVLLNEPDHYVRVASLLKPEAIRDPQLAAVARELVELIGRTGTFRIDELIGRFESPDFGRLITDLQSRGERRGRYAAAIEGAIACLRSHEKSRQVATLAAEIRALRQDGKDTEEPPASSPPTVEQEELNRKLRDLAENARNPHFAAVGARRKFLGD